MAVIPVELAGRSYQVHVGRGLLDDAARLTSTFLRRKQVPVVADANAWAAHGERLARSLVDAGHELALYEVPPGDGSKSRSEEHTSELQSLMRISYAVF